VLLELHQAHGLFTKIPSAVIHNALKPAFEIREDTAPVDPRKLFTFGFLGRVERSKGIETLLAAATDLEARGALFRLRIAGRAEPEYLETLRKRWPLARIEYLGFVDAPEFLRNVDTLVVPSEGMEGLPNGILEAFSQGVPVIGSATGGIPEAIEHGATGFVFRPGNIAQLTDYMSRLQMNSKLRRSFGATALTKARTHLAPRRAAEYLAFLDRMVFLSRDEYAA
ncbi:MAG: glycosyltransferase, partial [Gammaproteobacteria bacterium]|nr:glycosyltransferase [Gammaproteobacteria bacterium]